MTGFEPKHPRVSEYRRHRAPKLHCGPTVGGVQFKTAEFSELAHFFHPAKLPPVTRLTLADVPHDLTGIQVA